MGQPGSTRLSCLLRTVPCVTLKALLGPELRSGLLFGVATAGVAGAVGLVWRSRHKGLVPLAGVALVAAALAGFAYVDSIPGSLILAAIVLALGGLLAGWLHKIWLVPLLLAVPGAWLAAFGAKMDLTEWATWFIFGAIVAAAPLTADFEERRPEWTPAVYALFVGGVFLAVPDTEAALVLLGVSAPVGLLPIAGVTFGSVGVYPAVGIGMWVIAQGAVGRPGAVLGAAACLGVLVVEPIALRLSSRCSTVLDWRRGPHWRGSAVVVIQLTAVLGASRIAGLEPDPIIAAIEAVLVLLAVAAILVLGAYLHGPVTGGGSSRTRSAHHEERAEGNDEKTQQNASPLARANLEHVVVTQTDEFGE